MINQSQLFGYAISSNGTPVKSLSFVPSSDNSYIGVYAQYGNNPEWVPLNIGLPSVPGLQQVRDMNRNISMNEGSYEDAHFYLRSAAGNNVTTAFYTNAEGGAIQSGDTDGYTALNLQPSGGLLTYGGDEVATKTWTNAQGFLKTIIGTANRITVSGNTINIASNYAGQNTITTLGTVTTGTWNGSAVSIAYGGTGQTSVGTNGQTLRSNGTSWVMTDALTYGGIIPASANLNTYQTTGIYIQGNNANAASGTNYPVQLAGKLEVVFFDGGGANQFIWQTYHQYQGSGDRSIYKREYYAGTWSAWVKILDTNTATLQQVTTVGNSTTNNIALTGGSNGSSLLIDAVNSNYTIRAASSTGWARGLIAYNNAGTTMLNTIGFNGSNGTTFTNGYIGQAYNNAIFKWTNSSVGVGFTSTNLPTQNFHATLSSTTNQVISRFESFDGYVDIRNAGAGGSVMTPMVFGFGKYQTGYGLMLRGSGLSNYSQAAVHISGTNATNDGTVTGNVLKVQNYNTDLLTVDYLGNTSIVSNLQASGSLSIGVPAPSNFFASAIAFPSLVSKAEILTGTAAGTYKEGIVIKHNSTDGTAVERETGMFIKLSYETSATESAKGGAITMKSTNVFANTPDMHFYILNDAIPKMSIANNGLVHMRGGLQMYKQSNASSGAISYYTSGFKAWTTYMAQAGTTTNGVNGNITAPAGNIVTSWALRNFIENAAGYGFTWEVGASGTNPTGVVMELSSNTGQLRLSNLAGTGTRIVTADSNGILTPLGTLSVPSGGTGATSLTGVVLGNGTSAMTAVAGTGGQLLRRNAGNTAYEFFNASYVSSNIYTADGTFNDNRYIDGNTFDLTFDNLNSFSAFSANGVNIVADNNGIVFRSSDDTGFFLDTTGNTIHAVLHSTILATDRHYQFQDKDGIIGHWEDDIISGFYNTGTLTLTRAGAAPFIITGFSQGTITSVSGTTNRITSTGGNTPTIDIASTYTGQASITTLGTVSTGTWNATTIGVNKGGTGATSLTGVVLGNGTSSMTAVTGTANQLLRRNAANTAYEFFTASYLTSIPTLQQVATAGNSYNGDLLLGISGSELYVGSTAIGDGNTRLGRSTLIAMTSGNWNTAIGSEALKSLTTGVNNTAVGELSLLDLISGNNNTAIGDSAAIGVTGGSNNVYLGMASGQAFNGNRARGDNNTFIGRGAGVYNIAASSTLGSYNIALGSGAGQNKTDASNQLFIGNYDSTLFPQHLIEGVMGTSQTLKLNADVTVSTLSGIGSRMVVADSAGVLSTQPIGSLVSQWVDNTGTLYGYLSANDPNIGGGRGIYSNGGYASDYQELIVQSTNNLDDDVEFVYRIDISNSDCTLSLPDPALFPNRVLNITNFSTDTDAGIILDDYPPVNTETGISIEYLSSVKGDPSLPQWIQIMSINTTVNSTPGFYWMVVKAGRKTGF